MDDQMRKVLDDLRERISIDRYSLDVEACTHTCLQDEVGVLKVESKRLAKDAQDRMNLILSQKRMACRKDPASFGLSKAPSNEVANDVATTDSEYLKALNVFRELEEQAQAFDLLYENVAKRSSLIREAVSLYVHSYYAQMPLDVQKDQVRAVDEDAVIAARREKLMRERQDLGE